ncbi:hypothetical protein JW756_01425 [Candidatus Woesearchaeota archaeon]|nr:hypothetical protein [Candidatus Woesearchaeota archaeon]
MKIEKGFATIDYSGEKENSHKNVLCKYENRRVNSCHPELVHEYGCS